jgi:hypothetical protein
MDPKKFAELRRAAIAAYEDHERDYKNDPAYRAVADREMKKSQKKARDL